MSAEFKLGYKDGLYERPASPQGQDRDGYNQGNLEGQKDAREIDHQISVR